MLRIKKVLLFVLTTVAVFTSVTALTMAAASSTFSLSFDFSGSLKDEGVFDNLTLSLNFSKGGVLSSDKISGSWIGSNNNYVYGIYAMIKTSDGAVDVFDKANAGNPNTFPVLKCTIWKATVNASANVVAKNNSSIILESSITGY